MIYYYMTCLNNIGEVHRTGLHMKFTIKVLYNLRRGKLTRVPDDDSGFKGAEQAEETVTFIKICEIFKWSMCMSHQGTGQCVNVNYEETVALSVDSSLGGCSNVPI